MRHRHRGRRLNRTSSHRKALFRNLIISLIEHGTIKTTVPKAKDMRPIAEEMITRAKVDSLANRRLLFARLRSKEAVIKLFAEVAPNSKNRPGGYIRILKCGFRQGDNAPMAIVQLVDSASATVSADAAE